MKTTFLSIALITFASLAAFAGEAKRPIHCQMTYSMQSVTDIEIQDVTSEAADVKAEISDYGIRAAGSFRMSSEVKLVAQGQRLVTYRAEPNHSPDWKIVIAVDETGEKPKYKIKSYSILGFSVQQPMNARCRMVPPPLE